MTIVMLENTPSSSEGGQELSFLDVAEGLAARGHDIVLLHVNDGNLLGKYRAFCRRVERVRGYRFAAAHPLSSLFGVWAGIGRIPAGPRTVVYANQYFDVFFAAEALRLKKIPFACHLRLPPPEGEFSRQYRYGLKHARALIAVSEKTAQEYKDRGFSDKNIRVVYNGISVDRFPLASQGRREATRKNFNLPADAFVVTYAGRLHPAKGIETLIEAFSQLRSEASARLVLAGTPAVLGGTSGLPRDYRAELAKLASSLKIQDDIVWLPHCEDMPSLYGASDAVVLPSLWSEPFGRVLIESMACGVPALGSRTGGIPEILTGEFSKFLFERGNARELAALLKGLKDWRRGDASLADRCRRHVESHFSLKKTVTGVEAALDECTSAA